MDSTEYQPEIWAVKKDVIYAAIHALQAALGYMPLVSTEVPQWKRQLDLDVRAMEAALAQLRALPGA